MTTFGSVLSVNAGPAAPMTVQGETIVSGFYKYATDAPERIELHGLVGDDHVDDAHDLDRAVLFYQRTHYRWWSEKLGRDLEPGSFGEQLTVDGPLEDSILIGDQLRIGDVLLEVTQPRIPCRKMAVRIGQEDVPIEFMRSGRTGFFCKVLETGKVQAGNSIELVRRGRDGITVAELADVLHRDEPSPSELDRVLSASVLPELVRAKLTGIAQRMAARQQAWSGNRRLLVSRRIPHGTEVVAFELVDPDGARLPDFQPGQFITLVLEVPGAERPVVRTYTIAGRSADGHGYRIAVKREPAPEGSSAVPAGVGSGYLHDNVFEGMHLAVRAPRGRFVLERVERPVVLLSAGIGITPMVAMLEELAAVPEQHLTSDVYFIHVARSSRELAFGDHIRQLVSASPRLHHHLMFSRPLADDICGVDFDERGRLSADALARVLPSLDADFYICGPAPFMADIVAGLIAAQVPEDRVHYEFFGAATSLFGDDDGADAGPGAVDSQGRPITVTFARSGVTVPWRQNVFSLLALAELAGLRPEASCRTGLCNTCVCRIDDGEIEYAIEPMDAVTPGKVAVCCARPRTSVMIDL